jgi:hypothetical protein
MSGFVPFVVPSPKRARVAFDFVGINCEPAPDSQLPTPAVILPTDIRISTPPPELVDLTADTEVEVVDLTDIPDDEVEFALAGIPNIWEETLITRDCPFIQRSDCRFRRDEGLGWFESHKFCNNRKKKFEKFVADEQSVNKLWFRDAKFATLRPQGGGQSLIDEWKDWIFSVMDPTEFEVESFLLYIQAVKKSGLRCVELEDDIIGRDIYDSKTYDYWFNYKREGAVETDEDEEEPEI